MQCIPGRYSLDERIFTKAWFVIGYTSESKTVPRTEEIQYILLNGSRSKAKSWGLENLKETKADTCVDFALWYDMKSQDEIWGIERAKGRKELQIGSDCKPICGVYGAIRFIFIIPDTFAVGPIVSLYYEAKPKVSLPKCWPNILERSRSASMGIGVPEWSAEVSSVNKWKNREVKENERKYKHRWLIKDIWL